MNAVTALLAVLLLLVQADLWLGKGNLPYVSHLRKELAAQREANRLAGERNARVAADLQDLKTGEEIVEERARAELGMVRSDEILVRVTPRR